MFPLRSLLKRSLPSLSKQIIKTEGSVISSSSSLLLSHSSYSLPSPFSSSSSSSSSSSLRFFSSNSPAHSSHSSSESHLPVSPPIVQHRPVPSNSPSTPWDFTPKNYEKVNKILAKFPTNYKSSAVMPLLTLAQEQNDNWLPLAAMNKVAEICEMPPIRVYEVATFYSMYNREKLGKYHIQLCGTTPCQLCGAEKLGEVLEKHLKVHAGETTEDGLFTWTEVECLGACANAPMIQINNHEFYENLTEESLIKLIENLRHGRPVKEGPQNGQRVAEGVMGRTTLKGEVGGPQCRDLDAAAAAWKAEQEKQKAAAEAAKAAAAAAAAAAPKK